MSELYVGSYQLEPMKYNGSPIKSLVDEAFKNDGKWVAQEKKDGALYMLEKIDDEHIYLFARTKSKKTGELVEKSANVPHIIEWAKSLPNDSIIIGEIYVPGGKSNDVTKIMGCTPENAIKRQKSNDYGGFIHYYIFDCIRFNGEDLCNTGFLTRFEKFENWFFKQDVNVYISLAPLYKNNFEQNLHNIFAKGGEGMVFKKIDAIYEPGKRPTRTYFKMKEHMDSIDLVCIGLEDPIRTYTGKEIETWQYWVQRGKMDQDGNYLWHDYYGYHYKDYQHNPNLWEPVTKPWFFGWKNAMTLGLYKDGKLIEVGKVASGLTDAIREDMAINPENYLNHVIECEAMSTTKDGALRHPVFIKVREDKNPEDCKYEEVFK